MLKVLILHFRCYTTGKNRWDYCTGTCQDTADTSECSIDSSKVKGMWVKVKVMRVKVNVMKVKDQGQGELLFSTSFPRSKSQCQNCLGELYTPSTHMRYDIQAVSCIIVHAKIL